MPLVKDGAVIEDTFVVLEDGASVPQGADVTVSFQRLEAEFDALAAHPGRLGVALPNDADVFALEPYLHRLELIVLSLPIMADGRAFSQARLLRHTLKFAGEIRARGKTVPDQVGFLRQVGVDAFELNDRFDLDAVLKAATSMSLAYQRGYSPTHGFAPLDVFKARAARVEATEAQDEIEEPTRAVGGAWCP